MRALFCKDTLLRPFRSMRGDPDRWISRLVFLLGPWAALWMVEILNENDVFQDLAAWQVLMNMIWYYLLFALCRLILGRRRRSAAVAVTLCFLVGLLNHYILRFRGRILFPADVAGPRPTWPATSTTRWTTTSSRRPSCWWPTSSWSGPARPSGGGTGCPGWPEPC